MRFKARIGQFHKGQMVASQWVDGIQRCPSDNTMVAVCKVGRPGIYRVVREEDGWPPAPNSGYQAATKRAGILDLAINVP